VVMPDKGIGRGVHAAPGPEPVKGSGRSSSCTVSGSFRRGRGTA
jgi:hypothetical protein